MFDSDPSPRLFALPPGVDFPQALVDGILDRIDPARPEALAQLHLIVNTQRMARRVSELFAKGPARFLPKILTLSDLSLLPGAPLPSATTPPLARRLALAHLVSELIRQQPDLAGTEYAFDLSDSLSALIDEMHGEGVSVDQVLALDVSDQSEHWARAQQFIGIAHQYLKTVETAPDADAAMRVQVTELAQTWAEMPPQTPILIAGSTGSRGTTAMLMQAVARLPNGAAVLPGFDFDAPAQMWDQLADPLTGEDHPQYRFAKLCADMDVDPLSVTRWITAHPPSVDRSRLVSLAMRPAPFTDAWLDEGPDLAKLADATENVTLIEAESAREEALTIALTLRDAAAVGKTAALITPDRMLTRQVTAALDRWDIVPDDSAGLPLHLSAPGRFVRQVAGLFTSAARGDTLIALLKHPLTHSGADRGDHLRRTRDLELRLRKSGPPNPEARDLTLPDANDADAAWANWVTQHALGQMETATLPLSDWADRLIHLAENLSGGMAQEGSGELWQQSAGRALKTALNRFESVRDFDNQLTAQDFLSVLDHLLRQEVVRDRDAPDAAIMIWGTLEARVQGADLVILGGLNEGAWPERPAPDPWLNRVLRNRAGLLLPDRRIGLSAHDWQQAINAPEVFLTRAKRTDDAEAVPSRWLNRLTNLLAGLPEIGGDTALQGMRDRGATWLGWARQLDVASRQAPAIRPSPRPPVTARPTKLSVTEIKRLIRDPYSIYARHVLRLRPLDPLTKSPDALLRGTVFHDVLEHFIQDGGELTSNAFLETARQRIESQVSWPVARSLWLARLGLIADWFVASERARQSDAEPVGLEVRLQAKSSTPPFTLTGIADRIDRRENGEYRLIDYKTGTPPSAREQQYFDKQLLLETAMMEAFGANDLPPGTVTDARFIGLGRTPSEVPAPIADVPPSEVWAELLSLITAYASATQGYTARRAVQKEAEPGDYDQLARFGEWDHATDPTAVDLT